MIHWIFFSAEVWSMMLIKIQTVDRHLYFYKGFWFQVLLLLIIMLIKIIGCLQFRNSNTDFVNIAHLKSLRSYVCLLCLKSFSIIVQVIIEMRALWLVENYNTQALIFKMAEARFLDVFKEKTSKMKENAVALIITWAIIIRQLFFLRLSEYCRIISSTSYRGLFDNIHLAFGE